VNFNADFKNITPGDDSDMENLIAVIVIVVIFVVGVLA